MPRVNCFAALTFLLTAGCYNLEPVASVTPTPGTRLSLAINDGGRLALGGSMGPEIRVVEGKLLTKQDSTYVLSMVGVNYLNGTFQKWAGETVRINSGMVSGFFEKRFSTAKTVMLLAGGAAAGYVVTHGYQFNPWGPEVPPPPPPSVVEGRFTLPIGLRRPR